MANVSFRSRSGTNANAAIRSANKRVLKSVFLASKENLTTAAILLESEEKRAIRSFPVVDTGRFLNSISHNIESNERDLKVTAKVGSTIRSPEYPKFLEFGTSKMSPKPTMRPTWNKNLNKIKRLIKNGVKNGVREGTR